MSNAGRQRGFNAAKKGSGQVGFQPAPLLGSTPPSADETPAVRKSTARPEESEAAALEERYERFTALLDDEPEADLDGLSAEERNIVLRSRYRARQSRWRLQESSPETEHAVDVLAQEWGISDGEKRDALALVDGEPQFDWGSSFEYVDSEEAATELQAIAQGEPFHDTAPSADVVGLVERVRAGEVLLSRRELDGLARLRVSAHQVFAANREEEEKSRLRSEWIPATVDRRCELCGQFISTRDTHAQQGHSGGSCSGYWEAGRQFSTDFSWVARAGIDGQHDRPRWDEADDFMPGVETNCPTSVYKVNKDALVGYSPEKIEDLYMGGNEIRLQVLSLFTEKRGFFARRYVVELPENMRQAVLEAPPRSELTSGKGNIGSSGMLLLASRIEPPFNEYEIKRLIDKGDASVLKSLLTAKRTHDTAARIVSDYPSEALKRLSSSVDGIDSNTLTRMSSSGDSEVRSYAAGCPGLSEDDAHRLSEDPDPAVREALIAPPWAFKGPGPLDMQPGTPSALQKYPKIGASLINDTNSNVAVSAFAAMDSRMRKPQLVRSPWHDENEPPVGFTTEQKFLISKIRSRERLNEIKKHVMDEESRYDLSDPDVVRFLAH